MKAGMKHPRDARGRDRRVRRCPATAHAAIIGEGHGRRRQSRRRSTRGRAARASATWTSRSFVNTDERRGLQRAGASARTACRPACGDRRAGARQRVHDRSTSTTTATARTRSRSRSYYGHRCTTPARRPSTYTWTVARRRRRSRQPAPTLLTRQAELVLDDHAAARLRRQPGRDRATRSSTPRAPSCSPTAASPRPRSRTRYFNSHDRQGRADRRARARHVHDRRPRPQRRATTRRGARRSTLQPDRAVRPLRRARSRTRAGRATRSAARVGEPTAAGGRVTVAAAKRQEGQALPDARQGQGQQQGRLQAALPPRARDLPHALLVHGLFDGRARHRL